MVLFIKSALAKTLLAVSLHIPIFLCILLAWPVSCAQSAERILSEERACSILRERMAVHEGVPPARAQKTWFCDVASTTDERWVVIGLHSYRQCDGICSSLRGWFAVNRQTGRIHEFDVADMKVGPPFDSSADRPNKSLKTDAPKDSAPVR